jgi:HJR/Mrr/RecB family endonuclease
MDALVAISSILYNFWPLMLLFGIRNLFRKDLSIPVRILTGVRNIFFAWMGWSLILLLIYIDGRRPILFIPADLNYSIFIMVGILTGGISLAWLLIKWKNRRLSLADAQKLEDLLDLTPDDFEAFIADIFKAYGYDAQVVGGNADHGVDVMVMTDQEEKWVVQCKKYAGSVGEPIVRDLFGTMGHEGAQRAYLITTGSFTQQAVEWAAGKPMVLYDGEALIKLIRRTQGRMTRLSRKSGR